MQAISLTDVTAISTGDSHASVLKSDGTVWGWGSNVYGQIGDGTAGSVYFSPVQVVGENGEGFLNLLGNIPVTGVTIANPPANISTGKTQTLEATVLPANATNKTVAWSSSDEMVALVDQNGKIKIAGKPGTATIAVTTGDGGHTASCLVTIKGESTVAVPAGGTVSVPIKLAGAGNVAGVQGTVAYDGTLLTLESFNAANGFLLQTSGDTFVAASGDGHSGDVVVGYAVFTAKAVLGDVSTLVAVPTDTLTLWDASLDAAAGDVYLMEVAITGIPPLTGDVTLDGQVNVADAVLLLQYLAGNNTLSERQLKAADVNGDGEVTVSDAVLIMRMCIA